MNPQKTNQKIITFPQPQTNETNQPTNQKIHNSKNHAVKIVEKSNTHFSPVFHV